ncbi:MAG TPA: VOC family protein [Candidatus Limnocylindrales bacterium]|nr:VOC family protein [Candidatus Limnocylindrales bacterium]
MDDGISPDDFHASEGVSDWRVLGEGAYAFFATGSLAESARFVGAIAALEGVEEHRPDIDIRPRGVTVRLLTKGEDWYGMTRRDVDLARRISAVGRELGLTADPAAVQSLLLVVGAPSPKDVFPFWQAALGYDPRPDSPEEDLVDPHLRDTNVWFEQMDEPRGDGGGALHVGIWVPPDQAEARLEAVLGAGGRLVRDRAPMWWTVADAAGNEADIASTRGRG